MAVMWDDDVLGAVLRVGPAPRFDDLRGFFTVLEAMLPANAGAFELAVRGGALADRVGYAFAAGYRGALAALAPETAGRAACLCATEEGGAHPRAIATRLAPDEQGGYTLDGKKQWATLAGAADELLVVASTGVDAEGKNRLRVVRVAAAAAGVTMQPMPPTPFAPEIPHYRVVLSGVRVTEAAVLPGDGYERYLKPFRTIEDAFVHAALAAHLVALARRHNLGEPLAERGLALLAASQTVCARDPASPLTHLALAGLLSLAAELTDAVATALDASGPADVAARLARDRSLFSVAARARDARRTAAWGTVFEDSKMTR